MLKVKVNTRATEQSLQRFEKQFRYAEARTLTEVAKLAREDVRREVKRVFDQPTPYTLNSLYIRAATPARLVAEVGFKGNNPQKHYLVPQIQGGARLEKRLEYHLRQAGVLPAGSFIVPAQGFPLDSFGNIPRRVYSAILSDVQAHPDLYSRSTRQSRVKREKRRNAAKRAVYFAASPGGRLPPGIYQRVRFVWGSSVRGVLMFVRRPQYRTRLPLREIVERSARHHIPIEFPKALRHALATAR